MKNLYKCEVCERTYSSIEEADKCEKEHTIVRPEKWWLIPFVGWFMVAYSFLSKKNAIILFEKNYKGWMMRDWIVMGPFIFMCLVMLILIKLYN